MPSPTDERLHTARPRFWSAQVLKRHRSLSCTGPQAAQVLKLHRSSSGTGPQAAQVLKLQQYRRRREQPRLNQVERAVA
ncbi:hypothetical protein RRG08_063944 [Elysia crispata]|uniref:Uncharacterized protein n=1 Tax=Elysia crispata TaxID=231223 RepID=A0AAE1CXH0_9GAST|nr:hypothetical protein RRG08_063944 [Elysia crispata]